MKGAAAGVSRIFLPLGNEQRPISFLHVNSFSLYVFKMFLDIKIYLHIIVPYDTNKYSILLRHLTAGVIT